MEDAVQGDGDDKTNNRKAHNDVVKPYKFLKNLNINDHGTCT